MQTNLRQYLVESLLAYVAPVAVLFPLLAVIVYPLDWATGGTAASQATSYFLDVPVLAEFWLSAGIVAFLVHWRGRVRPASLFNASRVGEWVWLPGALYITLAFLSYRGLGHGWQEEAIAGLFANSKELGNLFTAPFYMGIAYSLTRRLLRRPAEGRSFRNVHSGSAGRL